MSLTLTVDDAAPTPRAAAAPAPAAKAPPTKVAPTDAESEHIAEEVVYIDELEEAPSDRRSGVDRLTQAFPGAELLGEDDGG